MHKQVFQVNAVAMLVALVSMFSCQSGFAEKVVWRLSDHLDSAAQDRPAPVYNGKTGEVSMRGEKGAKYNVLQFNPKLKIEKNMVVKFSVRREIDRHEALRFAVMFETTEGRRFYVSDAIDERPKSFSFDLADIRSNEGTFFDRGDTIREFRLYSTNKKLVPDMDMDFAVKDFRFVTVDGGEELVDDGLFYSRIPCFQWAAPLGGGPSRLQISRTPEFAGRKTVEIELEEPQFVPSQDFVPGDWYWRCYKKDHLSDRWSDTHHFRIPQRSHTFRLAQIDMDALAQKPHPRFAGLETRLLVDGKLAKRVAETIGEPIPEDGVARRGSGMSKIDWLRKVGHGVVLPTARRMLDLGQHLLQGDVDPEVRELAKARLMEVAEWDPDQASSEISYDLGAGDLLIGMSWVFDALYNDLPSSKREKVMDSIEARCAQFAEAGVVPFTLNPAQNHTWKKTEALGAGAMVLLGHRPAARYWFESARNDLAYRFLPSMGFDGENQEGIAYWRYGGQMLSEFADILQAFSGDNLYGHPWLKGTVEFPVYCAPPGGYAISFADTSGDGNHTVRGPFRLYGVDALLAHLTKKTGFPYGAWYLGKTIPGARGQRPPVDLEPSKLWKHIGWSLFNTCLPNGYENVSVGLHAGRYFAGHQHADQNSFVINAYGDKLAIDGGAYDWYNSPHFKAYSVHTVAHNTVLVNGKGQGWRTEGADGKVETFYSSIPYGYTVGDASDPDIYQGNLPLFKRKLLFIKPDYVVIHDQLVAREKDAGFDWLLHSHTEAPIAFDEAVKSFSIVRPLARLDGEFLFPADVELSVQKSFTNLPCKAYTLEPRDPDKIPPEWTLFGNAKTQEGVKEYFVVMRISKTPNNAPLELEKFETDKAFGVVLHDGERTIQVLSQKAGKKGSLIHEKLVADADIACLELDAAGVPQSAFMGQGVQLAYGGETLLQEPARTNAHFNAREEWKSRKLAPVQLLEGAVPFDAYATQLPNGTLFMYSGEVDVSTSNTVYKIDLSGIADPVYVHANRQLNIVPESGEISLDEGDWFVTISSRSDLNRRSFKKVSE